MPELRDLRRAKKKSKYLTMILKFKILCLLILLPNIPTISGTSVIEHIVNDGEVYKVTWLNSNQTKMTGSQNTLDIFCHCGGLRTVLSVFQSVFVEIQNTSDFTLFEGENGTAVLHQYKTHLSSWISFLPWRHSQLSLPAYETHCFGVTSASQYEVNLVTRKINYWRILQMIGGAVLFLTAPTICRNVAFYYASGISIGVFASLLVLLFLLSRFMPRKTTAYSFMLFGGSFIIYILQKLWSNMREIISSYSSFLLAYVGIASIISFAVCYRYQPMTDHRSQNLIQWAFQIVGLILVFYGSEFREFSMAIVIIVVVSYNIPDVWVAKARTWWKKRFPPKVKMLSEAEYLEQTNLETKKSLEELRKFCSSPECKAWKYVSSLKDPIRFAKFVEGESHLRDDEVLKYDGDVVESGEISDITDAEITDDES